MEECIETLKKTFIKHNDKDLGVYLKWVDDHREDIWSEKQRFKSYQSEVIMDFIEIFQCEDPIKKLIDELYKTKMKDFKFFT